MRIDVLGPLVLRVDDAEVRLGQRPRRVLAALALAPGHPMTPDRLADLVWEGAPPPSARNTLQSYVSRLRQVLGPERVRLTAGGYVLSAGRGEVDAADFETLLQRADTGTDPTAVAQHLTAALALWRGTPYADLDGTDGDVAARVAHLERHRDRAREGLLAARVARGEHAAVLPALATLVAERPWDEPLGRLYATALHHDGRTPEALAALRDLRTHLREHLGLDPGHDVVRLEQQLLRREHPAPPTPVTPDHSFVGRTRELATLRTVVERATGPGSRGGIALVCGDPGIGKTRLAEHLLRDLAEAHLSDGSPPGTVVAWGRCFDDPALVPLAPWVEVLRTACDEPLPHVDTDGLDDLARAVVDRLHTAARDRPLLVVLDDLHWSDEASVRVLELLARDVAASPLVVLALFRDAEVDPKHPFRTVAADLARRHPRVDLAGLDRDDVAAYVARHGVPSPPDWFVDRLVAETDGVPFHLSEVLTAWRDRHPSPTVDEASAHLPWPLPDGVRGLTRRRLDKLPTATVEVLAAAAVDGAVLRPTVLARALGITGADVVEALDPAIRVRLVTTDTNHVSRLQWTHALVRAAVLDDLPHSRRLHLHRQVARALTHGGHHLDEETAARAARHLGQAAVLDEETAREAVDLHRTAAAYAARRGAHADAAARLAHALEVAVEHADTPDAVRAALHLEHATSLRHAGRLDAAADHFRTAADLAHGTHTAASRTDAGETEADAAIGYEACSVDARRHRLGPADPSVQLLTRALAGAHEERTRVRLLATLSQALAFSGQDARAADTATEAVTAARAVGDDDLLARTLLTRHPLLDAHRDLAARIALLEEARTAADTAQVWEHALEARRLVVPDLLAAGQVGRAHIVVDEVEALAESTGSEPYRWHVPLWRAALATATGQWEQAELLVERFAAAGHHHGYADTDRVHALARALLLQRTGRAQEALALVEEAAADDDFEPWAFTLVAARTAAGQLDRTGFAALAARRFRVSAPYASIQVFAACLLADTCAALGDADSAHVLSDLVSPAAGHAVTLGAGAAVLGDARHHLGMLAQATGDTDRARTLLRAAHAQNTDWGLAPAARESARRLLELDLAEALGQYERFAALAAAAPHAFDAPTRLSGWRVRDLVAHVAWGAAMEADALRRTTAGDPGTATAADVDPGLPATDLLDRLRTSVDAFAHALRTTGDRTYEGDVHLPTGTVGAPAAALLFVLEAGTHASDLAAALGHDSTPTPATVAAVTALAPTLVAVAAPYGVPAPAGTVLHLVGDTLRLRLVRTLEGWDTDDDTTGHATTRVEGPDAALALLLLGRLDASPQALHAAGLDVTGDVELVVRLKQFLPGP